MDMPDFPPDSLSCSHPHGDYTPFWSAAWHMKCIILKGEKNKESFTNWMTDISYRFWSTVYHQLWFCSCSLSATHAYIISRFFFFAFFFCSRDIVLVKEVCRLIPIWSTECIRIYHNYHGYCHKNIIVLQTPISLIMHVLLCWETWYL